MPVFEGKINGAVTSPVNKIPSHIISFMLTNTSGSDNVVFLGILYGSSISLLPYNLTLSPGDSVNCTDKILIAAGHNIYLSSTGDLDYYFSIE